MKKQIFTPSEPITIRTIVALTLAVLDNYLPEKKDPTPGKVQTYTHKQISNQIIKTMSCMKVMLADFGLNIERPLRVENERTINEN